MEEQTTPLRHGQTTAPSTFFPSSDIDEAAPYIDTTRLNLLLADITSLILLSASADRASGTECAASPFLADFDSTMSERMKRAHELEGIDQQFMVVGQSNTPVYKPRESKAAPMSSDIKRSYEQLLLAANSNTQAAPRPRSDVSVQSAANCNITDRPLCMTFDSGISSPASTIVPGYAEADYCPLVDEDAAVTKDLQRRLYNLKTSVEQRLRDSMAGIQTGHTAEGVTSEIRGHLCKVAESILAVSRSGHVENTCTPEPFAHHALPSSLLVFENTKLSAEVAYLKKKVEILEDIAGTKGIDISTLKPTMETISIGSQTEEHLEQSSNFDETDLGISDFSLTSPETNHLMNMALCKDSDFHCPSGMSTPWITPNKRSQRRKIEVPTQLKDFSVAASTSYLSINTWADVDNKEQKGSSIGCWRGLLACCYRPH